MSDVFKRLQESQEKRQSLLNILYLWEEIRKQGIDPDTVKSFGFNSTHLNRKDHRAFREGKAFQGTQFTKEDGSRSILPSHYTYVRLNDDSIKLLSPILKRPE